MSDVFEPRWEDLSALLSKARSTAIICTPFYSRAGLKAVQFSLPDDMNLSFYTTLDVGSWIAGISDPPMLQVLLNRLSTKNCKPHLMISSRLHAKLYARDTKEIILGSANLTSGGFVRNLELMIRLRGAEAATAIKTATEILDNTSSEISLKQLQRWIAEREQYVIEQRSKLKDQDDSQSGTDQAIAVDESALSQFKAWLASQSESMAGVGILTSHMDGFQNRQGHFKQSFYGCLRFLIENPALIPALIRELEFETSDIVDLSETPIPSLWSDFIFANKAEQTDFYSFPTLRNILSPVWGGRADGGGGASGTFRRMLPIVAKFLSEQ